MGNPKRIQKILHRIILEHNQKAGGGNKGKQMQDQTGKQPIVDNG